MKVLPPFCHPASVPPARTLRSNSNLSAGSSNLRKPAPCGAPHSTRVAISATSAQLLALQDTDQVDMNRVNALRAAIESGDFVIDPNRIADGMIASACELLK